MKRSEDLQRIISRLDADATANSSFPGGRSFSAMRDLAVIVSQVAAAVDDLRAGWFPRDQYKAKVEADKTAAMKRILEQTRVAGSKPWLVSKPLDRAMAGLIPYDQISFDRSKGWVDFIHQGTRVYRMEVGSGCDFLRLEGLRGEIEVRGERR